MQYADAIFSNILTRNVAAAIPAMGQFAALKAFNFVQVAGDKYQYKVFDSNDIIRDEAQQVAPGALRKRISIDVQDKSGLCKDYSVEMPVPFKLIKEAGDAVLQAHADILMQKGLITIEKAMFETFFADSSFDNLVDVDGVGAGWNESTSDPIAQVKEQIQLVLAKTGIKLNTITATSDTANALLNNENVLGRLSANSEKVIGYSDLARLFGVNEFIVSDVASIAGNEVAGEVGALVGTEKLLVHYKTGLDPRFSISSGLVAVSNTAEDVVGTNGIGIVKYDELQSRSTILGLELNFDMPVVAKHLGVLFKNTIH